MQAIAASNPSSCERRAPIGAPTTVASTQPFESTALTRSQRCFGTMSGNRLRNPLLLNGPVSDETEAMATSSAAGRWLDKLSVATSSSVTVTTT